MDIQFPQHQQNQRIVLEHTSGPHKGLFQITGHTGVFGGQTPPAATEPFPESITHRVIIAGLVASKRGYLLYREIHTPADPTNFIDRSKQR